MTAFSSGFEFDSWSANWCWECVRDADAESGLGCPILAEVFIDNAAPRQWSPGTDDLCDRYHCSEFEPIK